MEQSEQPRYAIAKIVMDGFMSFGKTAELDKLDTRFNAIYGPSSSGKTHIARAIHFVVGIPNMRGRDRLSELEFYIHSGTNYVNLTSVDITFHKDGVEDITISRMLRRMYCGEIKDHYEINGRAVDRNEVNTFFQSMNIDTMYSNFSIMEDELAKTVEIDPKEILMKLLQAAGANALDNKIEEAEKNLKEVGEKLDYMQKTLQGLLEDIGKNRGNMQNYREYKMVEKKYNILLRRQRVSTYRKLQEAIDNFYSKIDVREALIHSKQKERRNLDIEVRENTDRIEDLEKKKKEDQSEECKPKMEKRRDELDDQEKEIFDLRKRTREVQEKIKQVGKELSDAKNEVNEYLRIIGYSEKKLLRLESGIMKSDGLQIEAYDLAKYDEKQSEQSIRDLERRMRTLRESGISIKCTSHDDPEELKREIRAARANKNKLLKSIDDLKNEKKTAIEMAYAAIHTNFASIFSMLQPGSRAKLELVDDDISKGVTMMVIRSDDWRDFNEFGMRERSVVILSLLLAILKYKPVPFYLLDGIDAPFFMTDTDCVKEVMNMLSNNSQVILVSKNELVEGANVIYRTRCVDNLSTITRISNKDDKK